MELIINKMTLFNISSHHTRLFLSRYIYKRMLSIKFCEKTKHSMFKIIQHPKPVYAIIISNNQKQFSDHKIDNTIDQDDENIEITVDEPDAVSDLQKIRDSLYPASEDVIIKKLNTCSSNQEAFDIIKENIDQFNAIHASQAILILWDLQRNFFKVNNASEQEMILLNFLPLTTNVDIHVVMDKYKKQVTSHDDFVKLLNVIDATYNDLSTDALTSTLFYLFKMGISPKHETMQKMITKCVDLIDNGGEIQISSLAKFLVVVFNVRGLYPILLTRNCLRIVLKELDRCETSENLRLITMCLNNMHILITQEILDQYKVKTEQLFENKTISETNIKTLLRVLHFLNYPHWSQQNLTLVRKLMLLLVNHIKKLDVKELLLVFKIFQTHLEPKEVLPEIQETAYKYLSGNIIDPLILNTYSAELLACVVPFSSPKKKTTFEKLAREYIENDLLPSSIPALFKILRHTKTSDVELCDAFWLKTLDCLRSDPEERVDYKLLRVCNRYMHFNNNLAGTYRNFKFEQQIIQWLVEEIDDRNMCISPSKAARAVSFIIGYAYNGKNLKNCFQLLQKVRAILQTFHLQFNTTDCLNVSRGIRISSEIINNRQVPEDIVQVYNDINDILNRCTLILIQKDMDLIEINMMLRTYTNCGYQRESRLFYDLVQKYLVAHRNNEISSRFLRDLTFVLQTNDCLVPEVLDNLANYVIENKDHLLGDTIEKLLHLCYYLGYTPHRSEEFLEKSAEVIDEEKEKLSGLSLLQASLALCYYQKLPLSIVKYIFTEQFLEQLDEEIKDCYSKDLYPIRVRNVLMLLNRAVCIDYPETEVPWFHEKYTEKLIKKSQKQHSRFFDDVKSTLLEIVGKQDALKTESLTPYNYKIDYLVNLDRHQNIINDPQSSEIASKVAFILLKPNMLTTINKNIKGRYQLKQRHLEMFGYRVIYINSFLWYSHFMSKPAQKIEYLKSHLWPSTL